MTERSFIPLAWRQLVVAVSILQAFTVAAADTYTPAFPNVEYANVNGTSLQLDLYLPSTLPPSAMPVVIWIHGGGWNSGLKYPCDAAPLTKAGYAVISPTYRFAPANPWPAQIYDCKAVVRWVRANASFYRLDTNRIAAWGFSAGGHLASMLGTTGGVSALEGNEGFTGVSSAVEAVIAWSGPSDLSTEGSQQLPDSIVQHNAPDSPEAQLLGCAVPTCPDKALAASPVAYASADDPPFLIMHGTHDTTVPPPQARELSDRLAAAGCVDVTLWYLPGAGHGGDPFTAAIPAVQNWLDRHFKSGYQSSAFTMADVCRAMEINSGFARSGATDVTRLATPAANRIDLPAVVRLARKVAGLSANP